MPRPAPSGSAGTAWDRINWTDSVPAGAAVIVQYRTARQPFSRTAELAELIASGAVKQMHAKQK